MRAEALEREDAQDQRLIAESAEVARRVELSNRLICGHSREDALEVTTIGDAEAGERALLCNECGELHREKAT